MANNPYGFLEKEEIKGLLPDIAREVGKQMKEEVELQLVPFFRAIELVRQQNVDATIMMETSVLTSFGAISIPLYETSVVVMLQKDSKFKNTNDLAGPIGRLPGGCFALENYSNISLQDLSDYEQGVKLILKNRLSGLCGTRVALLEMTAKKMNGVNPQNFKFLTIQPQNVAIHFHPKFPKKRLEKVQKSIEALKKNGIIQEIQKKYNDF